MAQEDLPYQSHHGGAPAASDGRVEALTNSLVRSSLVLAVLAVVIPVALYALFHRQAGRLESLADHGELAEATVTARSGGTTFYSYTVDEATHSWSVRDGEAPLHVGETFAVIYLPELPSFSRPTADRSIAAAEARANRSFTAKVVAGIFWFFAANFIICRLRLRRLRATGRTEADDPHAYRTRLILTAVLLIAPMLALVFGWHATDAIARNEAMWPVVVGGVSSVAVLGGTTFYVLREGVANAASRSMRLFRWAVPLGVTIAVIRALAWFFSR